MVEGLRNTVDRNSRRKEVRFECTSRVVTPLWCLQEFEGRQSDNLPPDGVCYGFQDCLREGPLERVASQVGECF